MSRCRRVLHRLPEPRGGLAFLLTQGAVFGDLCDSGPSHLGFVPRSIFFFLNYSFFPILVFSIGLLFVLQIFPLPPFCQTAVIFIIVSAII